MNKTYFKTILREIKESFGRFAAIFAIVALGVGFLAGLMITTPNMHASADKYYDENNMTDIFIKGTLGLKDEDLQALQEVDEIEKIMPAYVTDVLMDTGEQTMVTRVYGLPLEKLASGSPDFINRLELLEGRLPQKKDECLVGRSLNMEDIELGTVLTISQENDNYEDRGETYHTDQYTVVGIVSNPFYFSIEPEPSNIGNGRVGTVIYVDESNYALDVYTDFYITLKGAQEMVAFSEEYESYMEDVVKKLEVIGEERSELRTAEILGEAQEELEKGKKDYAEGKEKAESELASAWEKIQDGKKALADAQREIAQGEKDLKDGEIALAEERKKVEEELKAKEKELQAGEALLKEGKENLAQAKAQLDAVREDVEQAKALLASGVELPLEVLAQIQEYDSGLAAYEAGMAEIRAKESELAAGKAALEAGRQEAERGFAQGEAELEKARQELAKGKRELEKNQAELEKGEQEYFEEKAKVEKELQEAEEEIAEAEEEIRKIEAGKWYVLDRNSNISYASFSFNSDKIDAIAKVFPIFFLLVAALVALTTMTRMVEEERTQIGTLKALGYTRGRIMSKYIIYCGLASVIGSIVGLLIGFQVFPTVIWGAFTTMYELPSFTTQFNWYFALLTSGAVTLATLLATISVCNQALKEKPAQLMLPRAPKPGKRIFLENIPFIWKRLKFSYKATARNILRYKKHFFMTVIGIAGCTALLLTGLGLRDSVGKLSHTQYGEIIKYDLSITLKDKEVEEERDYLADFLADPQKVETVVEVYNETGKAIAGEEDLSASVYVPKDPGELSEVIGLRDRKSQEPFEFNDNSVFMAEKLAESLGLKPGDTFIYENTDGKQGEFVLTGITENYVGTYIYINSLDYFEALNEKPRYNTLLAKTFISGEEEKDQVLTSILDSERVSNAQFTSQTKGTFDNLLSSIDYIVVVIILAAGALAVIVLYNLTNININERNKELATLRVLGFHHREVGSYIFREISILSLIGTLVGLVLGIFLFDFVILTAESPEFMFGRDLQPSAFVFAALLTLFFSALVDVIMYQKLKKIQMVESLKAVD